MLTKRAIDAVISQAKAAGKAFKKGDRNGLVLHARPTGASWRANYRRPDGKPDTIVYGPFPLISLDEARDKHDAARKLLLEGIDPKERNREAKRATANTFAEVAQRYIATLEGGVTADTLAKRKWQLAFITPHVGSKPINTVKAEALLAALQKVEKRGLCGETVHDIKQLCGRVFDFAIAEGACELNPANSVTKALKKHVESHLAAITDPVKFGKLLNSISGAAGQPATVGALKLLPLVMLRPGELRHGKWAEVDFERAQWTIPAARMKGRKDHIVPLSRQAIAILKHLKSITGDGELMFPAIGPKKRPISENTLGNALRQLDYPSDVHTPHGFRSSASTILHEQGVPSSDIELQLSHKIPGVAGIYNRSERLAERTRMMQMWADHCDMLRDGKVMPFKQRRSA
jgi:integrase